MFWTILFISCLTIYIYPGVIIYLGYKQRTNLIEDRLSDNKIYKSYETYKDIRYLPAFIFFGQFIVGGVAFAMFFKAGVFGSILISIVGTIALFIVYDLLNERLWPNVHFNLKNKLKQKISAINKNDINANTMVYFGDMLTDFSDFYNAEKWYEKAIELGYENAHSKLDKCRKKSKEYDENKTRREREYKEYVVRREAIPRCTSCDCELPNDMTWGAIVETPNGTRYYCSRACKVSDGYGGR